MIFATSGKPFREWEFWVVFATLIAIYVVRGGDYPLVGEETRYARVAAEMEERHDWVVPRELGEPFLSRPPVLFWAMAGAGRLAGDINVVAIRAVSLAGVVATGLMIYLFGRTWLSRRGALLAALFWATFPELLTANRKAEADALFTFSVSACLFGWHAAYRRKWPPAALWLLGYALAAAATLVKGPQAPVCFAGTTWLFLAWRRDWRTLAHPGQLLGLAAFVGVISLWMVPYCRAEGFDAARRLWLNDSAARLHDGKTARDLAIHLLVYPLELVGCLLPWSLLLLAYLGRRRRAEPDTAAGHRTFLVIAAVVGFFPCWVTPGGMTRYFQPLYPALALLMAWPAQRLMEDGGSPPAWRLFWRVVAAAAAAECLAVVALAAAASAGAPIHSDMLRSWVQPLPVAACVAGLGVVAAAALWRAAAAPHVAPRAVVAYAAFIGFLAVTAGIDSARARAVPLETEVAALKATLPPGQPAYGVGVTHHRYVYYNRVIPRPSTPAELAALRPGDCVCVTGAPGQPFTLPVDWNVAGVFSMDRNKSPDPSQVVLVCQVVAPGTANACPANTVQIFPHRK